ncbi:hypothetical protein LXL04_000618 [Taraxacum kok-saghyz]
MHNLPAEMFSLFQNELGGTSTFPIFSTTAAKFESSQAWIGSPTTLTQATRSNRTSALLDVSKELNHLSQMFLLALKISADLPDLNFTATIIPPMYLTSQTSKPSSESNEGKLQSMSKLLATPISIPLAAQFTTSGIAEIFKGG